MDLKMYAAKSGYAVENSAVQPLPLLELLYISWKVFDSAGGISSDSSRANKTSTHLIGDSDGTLLLKVSGFGQRMATAVNEIFLALLLSVVLRESYHKHSPENDLELR